jgi:sugar phosphate isomerase/epimerase
MRYSLCSYSLHRTVKAGHLDIFDYIDFCKEAGFTQLDPWNAHLQAGYDDGSFLDHVKEKAAQVGLPFGCIAVDGAHIYEPTPEATKETRARRYRWLEIADYLGATQLRIDAGGRDAEVEEIFPVVVAGYEEIIARARPLGVEILIENHWGPFREPANLMRLLQAVPGLGLLDDSYNWPAGTHDAAWHDFAPYARLTHVKTFTFDAAGNEATWDISRFVHELQAAGYAGVWGIESTPDDGNEIGAAMRTLALLMQILEG